ncbi:MAG: internal scaffolding protein [Microviridae sp.]|nr:MAG: internal scaffolding protein [Microviridae sp.]
MFQIHSRYNPPGHAGEINNEPSLTQQHFQEECDINYILRKYAATGILDNIGPGQYLDLDESFDFHEAQNKLIQIDDTFAQLPSRLREHFQNDAFAFVEFVQNPANKDEGIRLGIFNQPNDSSTLNNQNLNTTQTTNNTAE